MRILVLTRYERLGSSSRVRFYQYYPYLQAQGIEITTAPFFDDEYVRTLYSGQAISKADVKLIENTSAGSLDSSSGNNSDLNKLRPLYDPVYESNDSIAVYENPNFLPRARFVEKIRVVRNSAIATKILWNSDKFDPGTTALVEDYSGPRSWRMEKS